MPFILAVPITNGYFNNDRDRARAALADSDAPRGPKCTISPRQLRRRPSDPGLAASRLRGSRGRLRLGRSGVLRGPRLVDNRHQLQLGRHPGGAGRGRAVHTRHAVLRRLPGPNYPGRRCDPQLADHARAGREEHGLAGHIPGGMRADFE